VTLESISPWLLGRCSHQLRKSCAGAKKVYSRAECVFILEHNFVSKSFAAVREEFNNVYPDKKVPNKAIHRLATKIRDTGSVCDRKHDRRLTAATCEGLLCWFHHDGETVHTANATVLLQESLCERTVGRGLWPPRSSNLTRQNFSVGISQRVSLFKQPTRLGETETQCWTDCWQQWPQNTSQSRTNHTKKGECLSSRRW
jgi:hypothetical protein